MGATQRNSFEHGVRVINLRTSGGSEIRSKKRKVYVCWRQFYFGFLVEEEEVFTSVAVENFYGRYQCWMPRIFFRTEPDLGSSIRGSFEIDILVIVTRGQTQQIWFSDREMLEGKKM